MARDTKRYEAKCIATLNNIYFIFIFLKGRDKLLRTIGPKHNGGGGGGGGVSLGSATLILLTALTINNL